MNEIEKDITAFKQRLKAAGYEEWTEEVITHGRVYELESPGGAIRIEFSAGNVLVSTSLVQSDYLFSILEILQADEPKIPTPMEISK